MTGIFERLGEFVTGKQKRKELAETITEKTDSFLTKFFPKKSETVIRLNEAANIVAEFESIKTLVLKVNLENDEDKHMQNILFKLSAMYFEPIQNLRKDFLLPKRDVSELINSLTMIKHIIVTELERKHKDVSCTLESIRLQALHILEAYFHEPEKNQIDIIRIRHLITDIGILQKKVDHLKEITKDLQQEYAQKLTQMNNIIKAVHELVTIWIDKKEQHYYEFTDKKQITDKLNFLIEVAKA
jgi:hypothetical protein